MWQYRIQVHFVSGTSLLLYPHCFFYSSQWITANIHNKLPYFKGKCMVSGRCSYLNQSILVKFCGEAAPSPADLSGAESGRLVGEKTSRQSRDRLCRAGEVWTEFGRGLEKDFLTGPIDYRVNVYTKMWKTHVVFLGTWSTWSRSGRFSTSMLGYRRVTLLSTARKISKLDLFFGSESGGYLKKDMFSIRQGMIIYKSLG